MSACGKKTSGPLGLGVSTCVRASWHDGECRPWLTSDERDEAELATLRADLARVTAERDAIVEKLCAEDRDFSTLRDDLERAQFNENANWHQAESYRSRLDAARAQVRELQKVARAAVYVVECGKRHDVAAVAESVGIMRVHVDALPPSMLEEPSDG